SQKQRTLVGAGEVAARVKYQTEKTEANWEAYERAKRDSARAQLDLETDEEAERRAREALAQEILTQQSEELGEVQLALHNRGKGYRSLLLRVVDLYAELRAVSRELELANDANVEKWERGNDLSVSVGSAGGYQYACPRPLATEVLLLSRCLINQ